MTFSKRVHAAIFVAAAIIVYLGWEIGILISYLISQLFSMASHISHLSGLPWFVGGAAAFVITCWIFSLLKIAGCSDRRAADMGAK